MQHIRSLDGIHLERAWLTIGAFDGLHLGHQELLRRLSAGARRAGAPAVVLTFYPHPAVVLGKRSHAVYLTMPEEQAALMRATQIDFLITHPFNRDVAALSAREFLDRLSAHLGFEQLWVGHDFAMGHNREGTVDRLKELGQEMGFELHVVAPVELEETVISSSLIRALVAAGDVRQANRLLGRPFGLSGLVVRGEGRGRQLGIPTANLSYSPERAVPGTGVYVCWAHVAGETRGAVTNVGVRPTFEDGAGELTVEAHLLDFDADLYGQRLSLDFLDRIRGEQRFPGPQALVAQIYADIDRARVILAGMRA